MAASLPAEPYVSSPRRRRDRPLTVAGAAVREIIPVAVAENGNVTISFEILSYAGTVAITVIADPAGLPDLDELVAILNDELAGLRLQARNVCPAGAPSVSRRRAG
ncbi:WS/DGAT domain-containing protein [Nonomuraea wenchangensis]|uniref:WS/DGAT domain-containing protein n=1 Tax=Nonomuraea wenchangensis TaxID=568860 RepID=UPI003714B9B4